MKAKHLLLLTFITLIAACTKDNETSPSTLTDDRDKFVGSWICDEGAGGTPFTIEIYKLSGDTINIKNFSGYGNDGNAQCVISGNSLTIPFQDIDDLPIVVNASGTGLYSNTGSQKKIKMSYTVDGTTFNNVVCTK